MKKFLVGLMSVFLLIGGGVLSACTGRKGGIELTSQSIEIELIGDGENRTGQQQVTVSVFGGAENRINTSYDNTLIKDVEVKVISSSQSLLTIKATGNETENASVKVWAEGYEDKAQTIDVVVFSYASSMEQKTEEGLKKNYLVRGETTSLVEKNLLSYSPSEKSRRDIKWELVEGGNNVTISGNQITIGSGFEKNEIQLKATNLLKSELSEGDNATCTITLPVLDKISTDAIGGVKLQAGYASMADVEKDDTFDIVSNNSKAPNYELNAQITYSGDLKVSASVLSTDGKLDADRLKVLPNGKSDEGYQKFIIYTDKDYKELNGEFDIEFSIGYEGYDYSVKLNDKIHVKVRTTIDKVELEDREGAKIVEDTVKSVYTGYATGTYGEMIKVALSPQTVVDADYAYTVRAELPQSAISKFVDSDKSNFSPLIIKYKNSKNEMQEEIMAKVADGCYEISGLSANAIYLVSASLSSGNEKIDGVKITITSDDEPSVTASFNIELIRAVKELEEAIKICDINGNELDERNFTFVLNSSHPSNSVKKYFKLIGQGSLDGFHVKSNSTHVVIEDKPILKSKGTTADGSPYVIFEVTATLASTANGVTAIGSYEFSHDNGAKTGENFKEKLKLDIFLPLTDAGVRYDEDSNSNSVVDKTYSKNDVEEGYSSSLTNLILKNGTMTPISTAFNRSSNEIEASPSVRVGFVDLDDTLGSLSMEELLTRLSADDETQLIPTADSNIVSISYTPSDAKSVQSIQTKNVGKTYAIFTFTGKNEDGQEVTIRRIIKIESLISVDKLMFENDKDRNISLYASDTIADEEISQTKKTIRIYFANTGITYADINENFVFSSAEGWEKYFKIENKVLSDDKNYIQFTITALTTGTNAIFNTSIEMHYVVKNGDKEIINRPISLNLSIYNAKRIEKVVWKNEIEDGLEFNVGEKSGKYLVFDVTPTNAKNSTLKYLSVDSNGNVLGENGFIKLSEISSTQTAVSVSSLTRMKGSIYVYPADMVNSGKIRFYSDDFVDGEEVDIDNLGRLKSEGETWFEYLTQKAYFISFSQDENGAFNKEEISFNNIIKKIDVTVVDGSSFEYSYKLYSIEDFKSIEADKYYTLKNNITIKVLNNFENFNGGLQGDNTSITFESDSLNLFKTLNGQIRNITLIGSVKGNGFVCDENNGTIENVIIETNGTYASKLNTVNTYAGGLAGINNGQIKSSGVLGLSISGSATTIGGIAGQNKGSIYGGKVEFYKVQTGEDTYATNKFEGGSDDAKVAGLVGEGTDGSTIERSYVYDYTLTSGTVTNGLNAPFIAKITGDSKVKYSFAVVGFQTDTIENAFPTGFDGFEDVYNSFYKEGVYTSVASIKDNNNFLSNGMDGFLSYVNSGKTHLKDLYQEEKTSDVNVSTEDISTSLGYKQVMVAEEKIIFMHYSIADMKGSLTQTEQNDLDRLNTISIEKLVGKNIKVSSSNSRIVKVVGSSLVVNQTGEVTLTFSSRQDASLRQEKTITVISAFNGFNLSYEGVEDVDNTNIRIQKTKTASLIAMLAKTDVYLGNLATKYQLVTPKVDFEKSILTTAPEGKKVVEINKTGNVFIVVTEQESIQTEVKVISKIDGQNYTHSSTSKEFTITPEEGAISINYTGEKLSISPSTNHEITVNVKTTKSNDDIIPYISYKAGDAEILLTRSGENGKYVFSRGGQNVLEVTVVKEANTSSSDIYNDRYTVTFAVHSDYQTKVDSEEEFEAYFVTSTKNESEKLKLVLDRQEFTSIDIVNSIITNAYRSGGKDIYVIGDKTSMLAPAHSSIMQISINPEYAYYDYVEIGYNGLSVEGGVDIVLMEESGDNFIKSSEQLERIGEYFRYTPSAENRRKLAQVFFKIWINTTVEIDSTIVFTVRFMKNGEERPEDKNWANYYIDVSYLKEPKISIDGQDVAFLAKGGTCDLKIEVLENQKLDTLVVDGDVKGINITSIVDNGFDATTGIRTYTARISATLNAKVKVGDGDVDTGTFYLKATVRRSFNGFDETKNAIATVVLVDFKLDEDNILIGEKTGNSQVLEIWAGVPKTISINYSLDPSEYPSAEANREEAQDLIKKRNEFLNNGYYPATDVDSSNYIINYRKDNDGYKQSSISDRLYYIINGKEYSINDDAIANKTIKVEGESKNSFTITGNVKSGNSVNMVLYTYIIANGIEKSIPTYFTVKIETFSDEDLPLVLNDAEDFMALNPENDTLNPAEGDRKAEDYILTNDIILENYTPFDTTYISSLDGNGYTIYIKSFATPEVGDEFKVALFENVTNGTLLKNIRVNIYEGGQLKVNVSQFKKIEVAGFALENNGIITNCEVVAFYTDATYDVGGTKINCTNKLASDKDAGINLFLTNGENTSEEAFITKNSSFAVSMAGFILENKGSITNSRVGGDDVYILVKEQTNTSGQNIGVTTAEEVALETFTMVGQGNVAGFALNNSGTISASFAKNVDIENKSNLSDYYLAGFVGENSGNIVTSYVEGVTLDSDKAETARRGSSLRSRGYIAGFVYSNTSTINDSYSNILISSSSSEKDVLYASGFVYNNTGKITNGFSASQVENSKFTQMSFSGTDKDGNLLTNGEYENCYFYQINVDTDENDTTSSTEAKYSTGAVLIADPSVSTSFYGFAITTSTNDDSGIWRMIDGQITLIEPNKISISHRYILYVSEDFEGTSRKDENGSYILPYATISGNGIQIDTSLGGENNPVIISSAKGFVEAMGESKSTYVKKYFNDISIYGSYRFVNDIDLSSLTIENASYMLPSTTRSFSGKLYGNGFTIQGLQLTSSDKNVVSYGLFKSLEPTIKSSAEFGYNATFNPLITNLTLNVEGEGVIAGVPMVGALAGYAKNVTIVGLDINFADNATIVGDNLVGGAIGYVFGASTIKNVAVSNPNTYAQFYTSTGEQYVTNEGLNGFRTNASLLTNGTSYQHTLVQKYLKQYSYTGSVFGFVDIYRENTGDFDYSLYQNGNYHINNLKVTGMVKSKAMVVGGAIGFVGPQTFANDVSVVFDGSSKESSSSLYSMYGYAGGVIGQSYGGISRIYAQHTDEVQEEIESNMYKYYDGTTSVERGILNIFVGEEDYPQKAIGGLIGYVGGGILQTSYSKINVISPDATYAGGIIGELRPLEQEYPAETRISSGINTTYLIHEVYATGDVRGETKAGGIIGVSKGRNISLLAVNAYNYLSSYDYNNDKELSLKEGGENNLSIILKFNLFIGEVYKKDTSGEYNTKLEGSKTSKTETINDKNETVYEVELSPFTNIITFEQGHSIEEGVSNLDPSISYYQNYKFSGVEFKVNLLDGVNGGDYTLEGLLDKVTVIEGPHEFVTTSSTYTQQGFLKSGLWLEDHWTHEANDLFPEIEHRSSSQTIFLDCYNVKQVFDQMRYNNVTVIIRGRTAPGADTYSDIDLTEDRYKALKAVEGFYGVLKGDSKYKVTGTGEDVRIISNRNFINSTNEGFEVKNVIVRYTNGNDLSTDPIVINSGTGLFVNGTIKSSKISGLTIELENGVKFQNVTKGGSVGLVAPEIISSDVEKVTIEAVAKNATTGVNLGTYLLTVDNNESISSVGLVAGTLTQKSEIATMTVKNIKVDAKRNDLLSSTSVQYAGGLFGMVEKSEEKNVLSFYLNEIRAVTNSENTAVAVTGSDSYVGGAVGYVKGLTNVAFNEDSANTADKVNSNITITGSTTNLFVGAVGKIENVADLITPNYENGLNTTITLGKDKENFTAIDLYAGGFAGQISGASGTTFDLGNSGAFLKIDGTNATLTNAYVGGLVGANGVSGQTLASITINNVGNGNGVDGTIKVTDTAYVGGLVGTSYANMTINGSTANGSAIKTSGTIDITGSTVYFGGLVGSVAGTFTMSAITYGALIEGNANIATNGDKVLAGGVIGYCGGNISINNGAAKDSNVIRYDGSVKVNTANNAATTKDGKTVYENKVGEVAFGGIVGKQYQSNSSDTALEFTTSYTSFGGSLTVFGDSGKVSEIYAGGVVGYVTGNGTSTAGNTKIDHAYNYGDVFVNNTYVTQTNRAYNVAKYYFGGLVGCLSGSGTCTATNNYSLMSSHNSRYSTATKETAHAMIGGGSIVIPEGKNVDDNCNYYNHKVCLLTDDQATDVGYTTPYSDAYRGYNDSKNTTKLADTISGAIKLTTGESFGSGHKLNPKTISSSSTSNSTIDTVTNSIAYFTIISEADEFKDDITINNKEEKYNIAYIYESNKAIKFTSTYATDYGFINSLDGYSYASGIVIENERIIKEATAYTSSSTAYAGLVGSGTINTIVYACQAKGSIEVGGSGKVKLAGLVGETSGKVFDSSTDIELLYRAGSGGFVAGLIGQNGSATGAFIENCYTGGKITTYISANSYILGETNNSIDTIYQNCYSYTHLDLNDYVNSEDSNTVSLIKGGTNSNGESLFTNVYYDQDATEKTFAGYGNKFRLIQGISTIDVEKGKLDSRAEEGKKTDKVTAFAEACPIEWEQSSIYNYGYPTLKYGYLKISSFAQASKVTAQGSNYDSYVFDITYINRDNGYNNANGYKDEIIKEEQTLSSAETSDDFYKIPNATVLNKVKDLSATISNFTLTNDINLANTSFSDKNLSTSDMTFSGRFDGYGNTISGLKSGLFKEIEGKDATAEDSVKRLKNYFTYVINLRLTDVNITSVSNNSAGALAMEQINVAFISNMTLSGTINYTGNSPLTLGGLTGIPVWSRIACVTNLIMVSGRSNSKNDSVHVAGIAGQMNSSKLSYCSNYGPINATAAGDYGKNILAGGLVGWSYGESTIEYSYNATSVLSGYATPGATSLESSNNVYYAAGIVAQARAEEEKYKDTNTYVDNLKITNCYNSGMIKAGNKTQTAGAFAAGIIANGGNAYSATTPKGTTVSNCYNEGSIEALGENPDFSFYVGDSNGTARTDGRYIWMEVKATDRNVWSHQLACQSVTIQDCSTESTGGTSTYIGAITKATKVNFGDIDKNVQPTQSSNGGHGPTSSSDAWLNVGKWWAAVTWIVPVALDQKNDISSTVKVIRHDSLDKIEDIKYLSKDKFGLPTRIAFPTKTKVTITIQGKQTTATTTKTYKDSKELGLNNANWYSELESGCKIDDSENSGNITLSSLKSACRSQQTSSSGTSSSDGSSSKDKKDTTTINSTMYYLANSNNVGSKLLGQVYTVDKVVGQKTSLPYIANASYDVTFFDNNGEKLSGIFANNLKVENNNGKAKVSFTPVSYNPINEGTSISYTVSMNYSKKKEIDTSNLNYVYINDKSFGITGIILDEDSLKSAGTINGKSVYAFTLKEDDDETTYYFGYDKDKQMLTYTPNESLNGKSVNVENSFDITDAQKMEKIINKFAGKTLSYNYFISGTEDFTEEDFLKEVIPTTKIDDSSSNLKLKYTFTEDDLTNKYLLGISDGSRVVEYTGSEWQVASDYADTLTVSSSDNTLTIEVKDTINDTTIENNAKKEILNSLYSSLKFYDYATIYPFTKKNTYKYTFTGDLSSMNGMIGDKTVVSYNITTSTDESGETSTTGEWKIIDSSVVENYSWDENTRILELTIIGDGEVEFYEVNNTKMDTGFYVTWEYELDGSINVGAYAKTKTGEKVLEYIHDENENCYWNVVDCTSWTSWVNVTTTGMHLTIESTQEGVELSQLTFYNADQTQEETYVDYIYEIQNGGVATDNSKGYVSCRKETSKDGSVSTVFRINCSNLNYEGHTIKVELNDGSKCGVYEYVPNKGDDDEWKLIEGDSNIYWSRNTFDTDSSSWRNWIFSKSDWITFKVFETYSSTTISSGSEIYSDSFYKTYSFNGESEVPIVGKVDDVVVANYTKDNGWSIAEYDCTCKNCDHNQYRTGCTCEDCDCKYCKYSSYLSIPVKNEIKINNNSLGHASFDTISFYTTQKANYNKTLSSVSYIFDEEVDENTIGYDGYSAVMEYTSSNGWTVPYSDSFWFDSFSTEDGKSGITFTNYTDQNLIPADLIFLKYSGFEKGGFEVKSYSTAESGETYYTGEYKLETRKYGNYTTTGNLKTTSPNNDIVLVSVEQDDNKNDLYKFTIKGGYQFISATLTTETKETSEITLPSYSQIETNFTMLDNLSLKMTTVNETTSTEETTSLDSPTSGIFNGFNKADKDNDNDIQANTIIILNPKQGTSNVTLFQECNDSDDGKGKYSVSGFKQSSDIKNIIFLQDVSLDNGSEQHINVNVYGNGYYLSLYNTNLNVNLLKANNNINNLKILGETSGQFIDATAAKLVNVSFYGRCYKSDTTTVFNVSNAFSTYVCIEQDNNDVINVSAAIVTNFGTIIGKRGNDATSTSDAQNGQSISFGSNSTNNGVVKVGGGGNGWYRSKYFSNNVLSEGYTEGDENKQRQITMTPYYVYDSNTNKSCKTQGGVYINAESKTTWGIDDVSGEPFSDPGRYFAIGALLLGYTYTYGANNTYVSPEVIVLKSATISLTTIEKVEAINKENMPKEYTDNILYYAVVHKSSGAVGKSDDKWQIADKVFESMITGDTV